MMDRNREARRGAMAAVNGGVLSRRRQQRTTNLRDSPEEDGAMEMQPEPSRLRDRGIKKDRDRDRERSSRSKRRRGERLMHSNREEGDDSSEESIEDDDEDEDEDASVTVRLPTTVNSAQIPSSSSSIQQQNHHHVVKKNSFSANNNGKPVRPPAPSWKVAEEMIGVSIPRKARSSSLKRSQECVDVIHRQASTSPARPSPSSTTAVSPSSSNASVRKKKISSGTKQHRPPKIAKSSPPVSLIQEIEIEVAEVLYGMTRQASPLVNNQENCKVDSKDMEAKSSAFSPTSISQQQSNFPSSSTPMVTTAPKRKRPRKFDEERPASPSIKMESEQPEKTEEVSSPKSEKNTLVSPATENGVGSSDMGDVQQDSAKPGSCNQVPDSKVLTDGGEEGVKKEDIAISSSKLMEASSVDTNINHEEATAAAKVENLREEKFSIDLMAPPVPEKSSSDKDGLLDIVSDHKSMGPEKNILPSLDIAIGDTEKTEKVSKQEGTAEHPGNFLARDFDLKKQTSKEKISDLQLDLGKHDKDGLSLSTGNKQQQQVLKQQQKSARIDPKQEKTAPLTSMPLPVPIAGWPGGFPSFGYMGQVPSLQAVVPMDGNLGAAKTVQPQPPHLLQPQMRPKRCATHCYIAQNIHYHQQIARMHPFWPAAAAAAAVNVAKQYNLNAVPPSDSAAILGNPLQGEFPPPRSSGPLQDKSASSVKMVCTGPPPKEKSATTVASAPNSTFMEAAQRKQFLLPQSSQPGSSAAATPNMIHGPAFLFPINQQPAMANRSGAPSKPTPPSGNAAPSSTASTSSAAAISGAAGHSATTMRFNYAGLPPEAQYMTFLQNNTILPNSAYPFPIATAHVGGPPPFRGTVPAQAMPFFNGPFYSPQMVPSQQQQQQLMQQHQQQPNHQNPSTSSGSSSSQKHNTLQQQRVPGASNSHNFPPSKQPLHLLPHQARQIESEATCEDSPSTADSSRASQAPKGVYGQNFAVPMQSQNFALISPPSTAGGSNSENKQPPVAAHQHQALKVDLTASQAYALSFASFGGSTAAAATPGLDFSAIVQNPAMFQNLPEVARHGYPSAVAMAAAVAQQAAQQAAQHKKSHHEDGKSIGETTAANANAAADDGKIATATAAAKSVAQQHSLNFSKSDNDPTASNIMSNHTDATSHALNLLHPPVNSTQASNPSSIAPSTAVTNSSSNLPLQLSQSKQQYHHQMLQFQQQQQQHSQQQQQQQRVLYMQQQQQQPPPQLLKEQQQQLHHHQMLLQQQMASRQQMMSRTGKPSSAHNTSSSSNISSATMSARFPQGGLAGFPPSLIQGVNSSASQSPQWKTSSTNRAANPAPASSATSSSSCAKNQIPQQQQPTKQQLPLNPNAHHTHISFGVTTSSNKPSVSSSAAANAIVAGSPQNSVSKSSAAAGGGSSGGSPRASSTSKSVQPPVSMLSALPLQQQQAATKSSPSAAVSSLKPSSPITNNSCGSNRNMTASILGHPHITPSNSSGGKKLQPHQQQTQKQQPFQPPQLFFNNQYIQAQTSQRRQTEQPNSTAAPTTTSGMISLTPASLTLAGGVSATSDPAKAAAAGNIKGLTTQQQQQAGILQHGPNPFMSAAFNYVQVMSPSSVPVKPASAAATTPDQKQPAATGNENVHACWKPEKR